MQNAYVEAFRVTSRDLDFWVDVTLFSHDGRWLAVAFLGGDPEIGLGSCRDDAVRNALQALGGDASMSLMNSPDLPRDPRHEADG
jgi:hypothetical protein